MKGKSAASAFIAGLSTMKPSPVTPVVGGTEVPSAPVKKAAPPSKKTGRGKVRRGGKKRKLHPAMLAHQFQKGGGKVAAQPRAFAPGEKTTPWLASLKGGA